MKLRSFTLMLIALAMSLSLPAFSQEKFAETEEDVYFFITSEGKETLDANWLADLSLTFIRLTQEAIGPNLTIMWQPADVEIVKIVRSGEFFAQRVVHFKVNAEVKEGFSLNNHKYRRGVLGVTALLYYSGKTVATIPLQSVSTYPSDRLIHEAVVYELLKTVSKTLDFTHLAEAIDLTRIATIGGLRDHLIARLETVIKKLEEGNETQKLLPDTAAIKEMLPNIPDSDLSEGIILGTFLLNVTYEVFYGKTTARELTVPILMKLVDVR